MASPTMTGLASLLLQDWAVQFPGDPFPRNSTLKVLFAQSAVDRGNVGPDYQFGYGSVRVDAAIDLMRTGAFDEDSVSQSFSNIYSVTVAPLMSRGLGNRCPPSPLSLSPTRLGRLVFPCPFRPCRGASRYR